MARRDQPYISLYVQDFLTDEKLVECSAEAHGVYIRLMCLMHKSSEYGKILLKQKDKQNESNILNFACKLDRQMPFSVDVIERSLTELLEEGVLTMEGDTLFQKRMVRDGKLSDTRALAGSKGGKNSSAKSKSENFATDFAQAKSQANTEIEIENEYEDDTNKKEVGTKEETIPARGKKEFPQDHKAYLLAKYLADRIQKRMPSAKLADEKKLQLWADALDKCNRLDGHSWDEIKRVLKFSQDDPFWQANILSGAKFREKYLQLLAKMLQPESAMSSANARRNAQYQRHEQPEVTPLEKKAIQRALAEAEEACQ